MKWLAGIIGTILLGAIGSGVWDWVLSDFFSWLGSSAIALASSVSQTYLDSLYSDVWRGEEYTFLKDIFTYTFIIYLSIPFLAVFIVRQKKNNTNGSKRKRKPNLYFVLFLGFSVLVMLTIKIWQTEFTVKTASVLQANIVIVSPYIDNQAKLSLEAKFRTIDTQGKALELKNSLETIAKNKNVSLHTMDSI